MSELPLPEFYRLEDLDHALRSPDGTMREVAIAVCSFKTSRYGIMQIGYSETGVIELENEPNLNMLTEEQQDYIEKCLAAAYYIAVTEFC